MVERKDLWALAFCILIAGVAAMATYVLFRPPALEPTAVTHPSTAVASVTISAGVLIHQAAPANGTSTATKTTALPLSPTVTRQLAEPTQAPPTPPTIDTEGTKSDDSGVRLITVETEYQQPPPFTYAIILPQLEGRTPAHTEAFNRAVQARATAELDEFQRYSTEEDLTAGGGFHISYTVPYVSDRLVSVRLDIGVYVVGNAHPGAWTTALNYDLAAGRVLALADLFQPGVDYLGALSRYCLEDLAHQDMLYWEDGGSPLAENYESKWNFGPAGLIINFDTYTVAPGAAGPSRWSYRIACCRTSPRRRGRWHCSCRKSTGPPAWRIP